MTRLDNARVIRAPRGTELIAKSWLTEAPLRMLMNNLDPEVAEKPERAGRLWRHRPRGARLGELRPHRRDAARRSSDDETLLVQSGKPVGVFRTHADAPRVLIANSNLVPHWATWEHFNELDRKGLMMYGQMTAGSWIYIGTQGIVQGTYETFVEVGRQHYGGDLAGSWILTAGLGGMGGAQPLAATMAGASLPRGRMPAEPHRDAAADRAISTCSAETLDEALAMIERWPRPAKPISVGLLGNAAEILPELVRRGVRPDVVTDQTSAHDPLNGYLPKGWTLGRMAASKRDSDPEGGGEGGAQHRWREHVRGDARLPASRACRRSTTATTSARWRKEEGVDERLRLSRLRAGLYPPAVLPRHRPVPLGGALGRSGGHLQDRRQGEGADARTTRICTTGSTWRASASPSRACRRASAGSASATATASASPSTRWWPSGELKAPVVIGRDHLDSGSVASPNRETEAMKDGSDAVSDWPLLNALLNTRLAAPPGCRCIMAAASAWASRSMPAWSSSPTARRRRRERLERVLWNDPATGVMRHADAGYDIADRLRAGAPAQPARHTRLAERI